MKSKLTNKVLLVAMLDSIHTSRWLSQFVGTDTVFSLFPSRRFRKIHPVLVDLIKKYPENFQIQIPNKLISLAGYIDFLFIEISSSIFGCDSRLYLLEKLSTRTKAKYIHALEFQGAGYLCADLESLKQSIFIVTNWGSDIYFYQDQIPHRDRIIDVLSKANFYSAECSRDYELARKFGFTGNDLPCIPNTGGFRASDKVPFRLVPSKREQIIVKAYGGTFGRGDYAIQAVYQLLKVDPKWKVFFYSVTPDLVDPITQLTEKYPEKIRYVTQKDNLPHELLMDEFSKSAVYLGCSRSDGLSTSFMEAASMGTFPIQTDTSCAGEWVDKGITAKIIPCELTSVVEALLDTTEHISDFDSACDRNVVIIQNSLKWEDVRRKAMRFYEASDLKI